MQHMLSLRGIQSHCRWQEFKMSLFLRSDDDSVVPSPLPQAAGYAVVVAVGLIFAVGMFRLN